MLDFALELSHLVTVRIDLLMCCHIINLMFYHD